MSNTRNDFEKWIGREDAEYDVIVCGSGMAGLGAALAAGRNGARTLLVEGQGVLGGITHCCLWMPLGAWNRPKELLSSEGEDPSRGGVHRLFEKKVLEMGPDAYDPKRRAVHPDYLRVAMFELLEEAGCHYRLYSPVTGVAKEGNRVSGVIVTGKEGPRTFRAKVVVDATGEGDVAFFAGAQFNKGRAEDGMLMPVTLTFVLGNVDLPRLHGFKPGLHEKPKEWYKSSARDITDRYMRNPGSNTPEDDRFNAILSEARVQGYTTAMWYAFTGTSLPGVATVNNGGLWDVGCIDGTRSADLTLAERAGSRIAVDFVRIAHKWQIPGLSSCHLLRVANAIAVREARCIIGDYVIGVEDLLEGRVPDDTVARAHERGVDTVYYHSPAKGLIGIPYRALLPKGIEGLLMAGRCISATHDSLGGLRGMGSVMSIGQGAGVGAALAARKGVVPRQVSAKDIQAKLAEMGVKL
jgi:hypothetical protein